ncbi:polarity establishment/cellular polarization [Rhizina undulata]
MLLTSIKQIEKRTFPTNEAFHFDSELPKRTTNLYCAYLPGPKGTFKIYGYTVYVRSKLVTRIHKVCVVEEQRGKGIGKWMVGLVLRDLKKGGSTTVDLWVDESRDAAWKLVISYKFPDTAGGSGIQPLRIYIFAVDIFSDIRPINYNLTDSPAWLKLDGDERRLHGTPSPEDVGVFTARISASDTTGSATHVAYFVVIEEPELKIRKPLDEQLLDIAATDGNGGVILLSGEKFNFTFANDTFEPSQKIRRYEALSTNNSPLPPWVSFHRKRIEFEGSAPELISLNAPPQSFDITLVASDFPGFAGASASFKVIFGLHRFQFSNKTIIVNAAVGEPFNYTLPRETILLDGKLVGDANLTKVSVNASDWLEFDTASLTFTETPTADAVSTKFHIFARDIFGDEA